MTANLIWSLVLAAVGIYGIYLAGSKNPLGWAVSFSTQALWFIFAIVTKQYGFILSSVAYAWVYGRNYIRWRNEKRKTEAVSKLPHIGQGQQKVSTAIPARITPVKDIPAPKKGGQS